MHELGEPQVFLGMEISRDRERRILRLTQSTYAGRVVERFEAEGERARLLPMEPGMKLRGCEEGQELDTSLFPFCELVGSLLYLAHCTRPDISYAVGVLTRYMSKPGLQHWDAAWDLLKYVKGTKGMGISFGGGGGGGAGNGLEVYADADWAGDLDSRRSTTGFVVLLNGGAINWQSKRQPTVAVSTMEAEYQASASAAREAVWVRKLMRDLGCALGVTAVVIKCDNQVALDQISNPISSSKSKHIDVMHHFVRDRVAKGEIVMEYCPTQKMVADLLTKALPSEAFRAGRMGLGLSG